METKERIKKLSKSLIPIFAVFIILIAVPFTRKFIVENLFGFKKWITQQKSGLTIEAINEIGRLTTAEYFGETYCTDQGEWVHPDLYESQLELEYESYFYQLKHAIKEIIHESNLVNDDGSYVSWWRKKVREQLKILYPELITLDNERYRNLVIIGNSDGRHDLLGLQEVYEWSWEKNINGSGFYLGKRMKAVINNEAEEYRKEYEKSRNKPEIVYLGRGLVTAGIDLTSLKEETPIRNWIRIKNVRVEVFDSIINPWFIPNEQPGFELFYVEKKRKATFEQATKVKVACLSNLKSDAIKMGIKLQALESAESTLSELAKIKDSDIEGLVLENESYFDLQFEAINTDSLIDEFEFYNLKSFVSKWSSEENLDKGRYKNIKTQRDSLMALKNRLLNLVLNGGESDNNASRLNQIFEK